MYKKKSLADLFNRKKTIQNDINRLQNIHKKINNYLPVINNLPTTNKYDLPNNDYNNDYNNNTIYKFNQNPTTSITFDISREIDNHEKIPKIHFKDIPIPSYSNTDKFDLNFGVPTPIHMNMFIGDIIYDGDINRIKKKNIQKIIHVYQTKYSSNTYPTGFGDFIRSCFFIIQFCTKYEFQYEIIINHPIAQFLKNFYLPDTLSSITLNNKVMMFTETNWAESVFDNQNYIEQFLLVKQKFNLFIDYLCGLPVINGTVFSYNILFPYDEISLEECDKIRSLFEPSREIVENVDKYLNNLLLSKNEFIVVHIRSGDSYLKNENKFFNLYYFEIIKNEIIEIIFKMKLSSDENKGINILLIADNNEIKLLLKEHFPDIKFLIHNITHIGEGVELENERVKNTMIDFYLMANSSAIYSFTSYPHGSGFSYWCAKMYNLPYKCKYISKGI